MWRKLLFVLSVPMAKASFSGNCNLTDCKPPHAGIWSWACGYAGYQGNKPPSYYSNKCFDQVLGNSTTPPQLRGWFQMLYWRDLEVEDGVFNWSTFDKNLTKASENNLQINPVVYIFDAANPIPEFVAKIANTTLMYHRGGKTGKLYQAPNYLNPIFQERWQRVIAAFAKHLDTLPPKLKQSVWAVQAVAGITGDNRPWNGVPKYAEDAITASDWMAYSRKIAMYYIDVFLQTGIPVIANLHDGFSGQQDQGWFLEQARAKGMVGAAIKEGSVTHWYNMNGERDIFTRESSLLLTPYSDGSFGRSRGELAVEPDPTAGTYGNWAHSPWWSLQANAEWCLTFGVDVWNLYAGFLGNDTFAPTMEFFNRHAGHKNPTTSPAAFISFRDSLDTADVARFSVAEYGPVNSSKNPEKFVNKTRMLKILKQFESRGASLGGDDAHIGGAMSKNGVHQKKAMVLYDVCWRCYEGNYGRYLEQIDAESTSVGWWQVGPRDEPYGRFARGLQHATNRTSITIRLDPSFGTASSPAVIRLVYLDQGSGNIAVTYDGQRVARVPKTNSGSWRVARANITLAPLARRTAGMDMITLSSEDDEDDIFSLLEVLLV